MEVRDNKMTTTTFLFIGDVHIRLDNLYVIDAIEEKIQHIQQRYNAIVLAGDVLDSHERIHCQLLNRACKFIHTLRGIAPLYILVGNHDYINNQQFLTTRHWMNSLKCWGNVTIVDEPTLIMNERFLMMPYVPVGRFIEALDTLDEDWKQVQCIFAHQEMAGCKMGAIVSLEGDAWNEAWPLLISGHIHEQQEVGSNIIYPGSCINHSFGHNHQGLTLFTFHPDGSWTRNKFDLGLKKKKIVVIRQLEDIKDDVDSSTKLIISANMEDIKKFRLGNRYKKLQEQHVKIVFKPVIHRSPLLPIMTPFVTILHQWVKEEHDPLLEKDLETLLKE